MEYEHSEEVILALLNENADAANHYYKFSCSQSRLLLHKAIEAKNSTTSSDKLILALLEANTNAASKIDCKGDLPFHKAIQIGHSDNVILALLKAHQDSAKMPNSSGKLPLQVAMESKCSETVVLALLAAYQEAALHLDSNETMNFSDAVAAALLTAKASRREQRLDEHFKETNDTDNNLSINRSTESHDVSREKTVRYASTKFLQQVQPLPQQIQMAAPTSNAAGNATSASSTVNNSAAARSASDRQQDFETSTAALTSTSACSQVPPRR